MPSQALRADLLMLITAMIWGSAFVAQRLGMDSIGPFLYTGLRFTLACLALLPVLALLQRRQQRPAAPLNRNLVIGGVVSSTVLTLFVLPVIYLATERRRVRGTRKDSEPEALAESLP